MTELEIAMEALEEIAGSDYSFEGHACLHCETAMDALNAVRRQQFLAPNRKFVTDEAVVERER